ncbi:MAG: rod shape-determining protein MreD [Synechococcus sp.]
MKASRIPLSQRANWFVTTLTVLVCVIGTWVQLPGMTLGGIAPDWPLIWVVCWSLNRPAWQGTVAGAIVGILHDSLTNSYPSHVVGLGLVGMLTSRLHKRRSIGEDFITVAMIVFGMVLLAETCLAVQWSLFLGWHQKGAGWIENSLKIIWFSYRSIVIKSAVISSLWAPAVYLPLNFWWHRFNRQRHQSLN